MANRAAKAAMIDKLREQIGNSTIAIATDYRGLTVEEITTLRRSLQENGAEYTVVKNTLAKLAIKDTAYEPMTELLKGPIALVLGAEDQVAPAKALSTFAKKSKKLSIVGGVLDGKVLDEDQVKQLAELPSKEELIAKIMFCVNSPATGIASCVNAVLRNLTVCVDQIRKQKEEQA